MSLRELRSAAVGTARLVTTDASVAQDRIGMAWVGNDGTWWLGGSPDGYPTPDDRARTEFVKAAELRAIAAAVAAHPGPLLILTDALSGAETIRAWVTTGATLRASLRAYPELVVLRDSLIERRASDCPASIRYSPRRAHELHTGADLLSKVAGLYGTPDTAHRSKNAQAALKRVGPDWQVGADRIAARAAFMHLAQLRIAPPIPLAAP